MNNEKEPLRWEDLKVKRFTIRLKNGQQPDKRGCQNNVRRPFPKDH